jgi:transcriptional regulator with XRE-family HTH domain
LAFPENLRTLRLARFFSQAELARRSGVHAITITRLETGRTAPSTRTVRALATALEVPPDQLASPAEVAEADKWQRARESRIPSLDGKGGEHV